ncbi:MAG: RNA methyltransferase [Methylococcales bacterium]|nr:RNA methyltransferase [Methylococcales bacterium]
MKPLSPLDIRQLRKRSERIDRGIFYAEGNKIVAQAIKFKKSIQQGIVCPAILSSDMALETVAAMRKLGIPVSELSRKAFNGLSFKRNPSGIGAIIQSDVNSLEADTMIKSRGWVVLDGVGNAGNLGAIYRTCDAVGFGGVILTGNTVDPYHPDTIKASMGAIFTLKIIQADMSQLLAWKKPDMFLVGTSGTASQTYREATYKTPTLIMMGSERLGLSPEQQAMCDEVVSIPMVGASDSLNLAVATSLMLYEVFHQTS